MLESLEEPPFEVVNQHLERDVGLPIDPQLDPGRVVTRNAHHVARTTIVPRSPSAVEIRLEDRGDRMSRAPGHVPQALPGADPLLADDTGTPRLEAPDRPAEEGLRSDDARSPLPSRRRRADVLHHEIHEKGDAALGHGVPRLPESERSVRVERERDPGESVRFDAQFPPVLARGPRDLPPFRGLVEFHEADAAGFPRDGESLLRGEAVADPLLLDEDG